MDNNSDIYYDDSSPNIQQHLIIHNWNSSILQQYEMKIPYMITFETCDISSDIFQLQQLTPERQTKSSFIISKHPYHNQRPLHQHDFFEIMFVIRGTVIHHVEDKHFTYRPGHCCIMNRNIKHCEEFSTDFYAVFFLLNDDFATQIVKHDIYYTPDGSCMSNSNQIYQMIQKAKQSQSNYEKIYIDCIPLANIEQILERMNPLLNRMQEETLQREAGYISMMESLFMRFISILKDNTLFCQTLVQPDSNMQEYLFTSIAQILETNHGRVSRQALEELLNYNAEYLNRIVKKYTGMNLLTYEKTFYLKESKRLLLETNKSISEIINELGFANRNHFYRIFKQEYGITPMEFRSINKPDR